MGPWYLVFLRKYNIQQGNIFLDFSGLSRKNIPMRKNKFAKRLSMLYVCSPNQLQTKTDTMQLATFRSNTDLKLDQETGKFVPTLEVVLVCVKAKYDWNDSGDRIRRSQKLTDIRFSTQVGGLNQLIEDLTKMRDNLVVMQEICDTLPFKITPGEDALLEKKEETAPTPADQDREKTE